MKLIQSIEQVQAYSAINVSVTLPLLLPYLSDSELMFIRPAIGKEFLLDLAGKIEAQEDLWVEALDLTRKPLVLYGLYLGIDEIGVNISGQGIQVIGTTSHTPAPQFKVANLKENLMRRAHSAMDDLLDFLESHRSAFPSFKPLEPDLLIRSAADFSRYVDIRSSRRVFLAMIPVIRSIEQKYIRPTMGDELFEKLTATVQGTAEIPEDYKKLLELVKPSLAHLAMARSLDEISIDILDWGVFANAESTFTNITTKQTANSTRILAMQQANQLDGDGELKALQEFLDRSASADRYHEYFKSSLYGGPDQAVKKSQYVNDSSKSLFFA